MSLSSMLHWKPRSPRRWLSVILIGLTIAVIGRVLILTIGDLEIYPGIDLRAKVVGARLLIRGMNPYYDPHHETNPDRLRMLSTDTYSPALLIVYAPLCELEWKTQRAIYFIVDWVTLLLCYVVLARLFPKRSSRTALWVAFVLLSIATCGFRLHLERGQYYIELALLAAFAAFCFLQKSQAWYGAIPLALLVLLRPTYAICVVCALLMRRSRHALYAACLCLLLFTAILPVAGLGDWRNYFREIEIDQQASIDAAYGRFVTEKSATSGSVIEGIDFSKSLVYPGYLADRTLIGVARNSVSPGMSRAVHWLAPSESRFEWLNKGCLFLACLFDLLVASCFSRRRATGLMPVAFLFLAPLNLELFAPQHYAYCDLMILVPLMLVLAAVLKGEARGWGVYGAILAIGFALPWMSVHLNKHVQLISFFGYVGDLVLLNLVCTMKACRVEIDSSSHGMDAASSQQHS